MDVTLLNLHHGSYLMEVTPCRLEIEIYTMEVN